MKNIFILAIAVTCLLACKESPKGRNGVTYKTPVQYNDYIITRQNIVVKKMLAFGKMAGTNPDSAIKMLDAFAIETTAMIRELQDMPPYQGDSLFRDAAVKSFLFYKRVFEKDYKELLDLKMRMEKGADSVENAMNELTGRLSSEEEKRDKAFQDAQEKFARNNHLQLSENTLSKEIEKAGQE
ncbi:MAG: hypothetical protein NTW29_11360 [Bacteroidetes bacterium]|nr:hypothetical protein [Bacteroidota bacterium]